MQKYQLSNNIKSATLELDESANIISYEEYYPYGDTSYQAGRSASEVSQKRYRYTGKEKDEESGLYYMMARYYAGWLGRWTAADPAGLVDGVNLYVYCRGNPVILLDGDGKQALNEQEHSLGMTLANPLRPVNQEMTLADQSRGMTPVNSTTMKGTERIVVSGGHYNNKKTKEYQFEFIDSALKEIINFSKEGKSTLLIADVGLTQSDKDRINELKDTHNFNVIYFDDVSQINDYINNGNPDFNRANNPITKFSLFAHGFAGSIGLGHGFENREKLSWTTENIKSLKTDAFDKASSTFYSCNTGTDNNGTSFAQEWSNITGGETKAAEGQTSYININPKSRIIRNLSGYYKKPNPALNSPELGKGAKWNTFKPLINKQDSIPFMPER